jgi:ribosomal protein S18 acetylase RimI-like enzyme
LPAVRVELLDVSDPAIASAVLAVQRLAYRVEADLIGSDAIPPLHETLEELRASGETFLGAEIDRRLAAFVSWKVDDGTLDLHRLAVHPDFFRRGLGRALVRAAQAHAPAPRVIVQTGSANEPAKALYISEGFVELDEFEPAPGIRVTRFRKYPAAPDASGPYAP